MHNRVQEPASGLRHLLLAATAGILLVTLTPMSNPTEEIPTLCILCGSFGTADFLLNVLMFVPFGYLLTRVFKHSSRALVLVVTATVAIELMQLLIPGRFPTVGDVTANIVGGCLGIWAASVRSRRGSTSDRRGAQTAARSAPFALAAALVLTVILLGPALPASIYYGQWTAELGQFEHYAGQVSDVRIGSIDLPGHRLDSTQTNAVRRIVRGVPLTVEFLAGPPTAALAPVFSVFDEHQVEVLVVGADGDALVVRMRRVAETLGFHSPGVRFEHIHPPAGTEATLRLTHGAGSFCIRLSGHDTCRTTATPARGWSLFTGILIPERTLGFLDFIWLAVIGFLTVRIAFRSTLTLPRWLRHTTWFLPVIVYCSMWLLFRGDATWVAGLAGLIAGSGGATHYR